MTFALFVFGKMKYIFYSTKWTKPVKSIPYITIITVMMMIIEEKIYLMLYQVQIMA